MVVSIDASVGGARNRFRPRRLPLRETGTSSRSRLSANADCYLRWPRVGPSRGRGSRHVERTIRGEKKLSVSDSKRRRGHLHVRHLPVFHCMMYFSVTVEPSATTRSAFRSRRRHHPLFPCRPSRARRSDSNAAIAPFQIFLMFARPVTIGAPRGRKLTCPPCTLRSSKQNCRCPPAPYRKSIRLPPSRENCVRRLEAWLSDYIVRPPAIVWAASFERPCMIHHSTGFVARYSNRVF